MDIKWKPFYLPNLPLYETQLPEVLMGRLWSYVDAAKDSFRSNLVGNLSTSLTLVDTDNHFAEKVVLPIANAYIEQAPFKFYSNNASLNHPTNLFLESMWVNFQKQHEFNPIHNHSGLLSFVIWMKIPTEYQDQHQLPFSKGTNSPSASDFQFVYNDMLGFIRDFPIPMGKFQEGWMLLFPSKLQHQVYPFYNCYEDRVSISGNIACKNNPYT